MVDHPVAARAHNEARRSHGNLQSA